METLPNEILEVIFDNIDEADKKPVREVCSKWYDMNEMKKMVIKYKNDDQERIVNDIKRIQPIELKFVHCHDIEDRFSIREILNYAHRLNKLKLKECYIPKYEYESEFDSHVFKNLKELKIIHTCLWLKSFSNEIITDLCLKECSLTMLELDCPNMLDLDLLGNHLNDFILKNAPNLIFLDLSGNDLYHLELVCPELNTLELSHNNDLSDFIVFAPNLTYLNIEGCNNVFDEIDYNNFLNLVRLDASYSTLTNIDISMLSKLRILELNHTDLISLDITHNTNLTVLELDSNCLQSLDVTNNINLIVLNLGCPLFQSLDLSKNINLTKLNVTGTNLQFLDLSNNTKLHSVTIYNNPNLIVNMPQSTDLKIKFTVPAKMNEI